MTLFEYLSVAVSIVLSLSAAQILSSIRDILRPDRRYWPHAVWTFLALFTHIVLWWEFWAYREAAWTLSRFVFVLVNPGLLFVAAHALTTPEEETGSSWEAHYYASRRSYFVPFTLLLILAFPRDALVLERSIDLTLHLPELLLIGISALAAWSEDRRTHAALALLSVGIIVATTTLLWFQPGGGSQF